MVKVMQFEPGDVVYLKSGSVRMTVVAAYYDKNGQVEGSVTVMWMVFDTKSINTTNLPHSALVPADTRRRPSDYNDEVGY